MPSGGQGHAPRKYLKFYSSKTATRGTLKRLLRQHFFVLNCTLLLQYTLQFSGGYLCHLFGGYCEITTVIKSVVPLVARTGC